MTKTKPPIRPARQTTPAKPAAFTSGRVLVAATIGVVVVAGGVAIGLHSSSHRGNPSPTTATSTSPMTTSSLTPIQAAAKQWQTAAEAAEEPAAQAYIDMVEAERNWALKPSAKAKISTHTLAIDLLSALRGFADARGSLAKQAAFPQDPQALADFQESVDLYSESAELTRTASLLPAGRLQDQVLLEVTRVRHLGDNVYDQASASLKPYLPPPAPHPGLKFDPTPSVPTWATVPASDSCITVGKCPSLAAGPPLDRGVPLHAAPAKLSSKTIATDAWTTAVRRVAVPTEAADAKAIGGTDAGNARHLADQLQSAQIAIARLGLPMGEPTVSETLQLELLIRAEALRSAEAADLGGSAKGVAGLRQSAQTLSQIALVLQASQQKVAPAS